MKIYKPVITLNRNERGIWDLDPSKGCTSGFGNGRGCYDDCYAARQAKIYGFDFSKTMLRYFTSRKHERDTVRAINKIDMPFIRMGCSGDPSENWEHTLSIIHAIRNCNKEIVIITKHWTVLTDEQLSRLAEYKVCINTSVSALTDPADCMEQYERLKPYCRSVLRVVSCDFNLNNPEGHRMAQVQAELFRHSVIDTVFRPTLTNPLVVDGIIHIRKMKFMNSVQVLSKFNKKAYIGKCGSCAEQCGVYNDHIRQTNEGRQIPLL